jgi:hypothetical protein
MFLACAIYPIPSPCAQSDLLCVVSVRKSMKQTRWSSSISTTTGQ